MTLKELEELEEQARAARERADGLEAEQEKLLVRNRGITLGFAAAHHGLRVEAIPCAVALIDWSTIEDDLDLDLALDELYESDSYIFDEKLRPRPVVARDIDAGRRSHGPLDDLGPAEGSPDPSGVARERLSRAYDPWNQDR